MANVAHKQRDKRAPVNVWRASNATSEVQLTEDTRLKGDMCAVAAGHDVDVNGGHYPSD